MCVCVNHVLIQLTYLYYAQAAHTSLDTLTINDCFSTPCLNGGSCSPLDFGYVCQCIPGYSGKSLGP